MQKVIEGGLILSYIIGSLALFGTAGGMFIMGMSGDGLLLLPVIIAGVIYVYTIKKMQGLLQKNEKLKAYMILNAVVWIMTFILFAQCANTTFSTH